MIFLNALYTVTVLIQHQFWPNKSFCVYKIWCSCPCVLLFFLYTISSKSNWSYRIKEWTILDQLQHQLRENTLRGWDAILQKVVNAIGLLTKVECFSCAKDFVLKQGVAVQGPPLPMIPKISLAKYLFSLPLTLGPACFKSVCSKVKCLHQGPFK
jgi:hypothetical protein